jgi:hypothetical protein
MLPQCSRYWSSHNLLSGDPFRGRLVFAFIHRGLGGFGVGLWSSWLLPAWLLGGEPPRGLGTSQAYFRVVWKGLHRASASLTFGIQEDLCCRVSAGNGFGSGGNKTKQVPGCAWDFALRPTGLLRPPFPWRKTKQPSWERCPGLSSGPWAVCCTVWPCSGRLAVAPQAEGPRR